MNFFRVPLNFLVVVVLRKVRFRKTYSFLPSFLRLALMVLWLTTHNTHAQIQVDAFSNQTVFAVCAAWLISAFVLAKIFGKYTAGTPTLLSLSLFSLFRSFSRERNASAFGRTGLSPCHLFPLFSSLFSLSVDLPREQGRKKRNTSASPGGKEEEEGGGRRRRGREQVIEIAQLLFFLFSGPLFVIFSSLSFLLRGFVRSHRGGD